MKSLLASVAAVGIAAIGVAPAALADQPAPWAIGFQKAASPVMERIESLGMLLNVIMIAVAIFVSILLAIVILRYNSKSNPTPAKWSHNTKLEILWTGIPALILLIIAVPSIRLLYFEDVTPKAEMTLKVTGHQWYWSYEYPDQGNIHFDSMIVDDSAIKPGQVRLLSVDNAVVLPVGVPVRVQIAASDVIHSWSVPSFGVKTDAVPGRLNETWVQIDKPGTYYGQCSQLCGVNHGFMPIEVHAVSKEDFQAWVATAKTKFAAKTGGPVVASAR